MSISARVALLISLVALQLPSARGQTFTVDIVPAQAIDLAWDPLGVKLYGTTGTSGSSVVPIDPFAHSVGTPIFVGSNPTKLAISDDSHYLYAGSDGLNAVLRVDLLAQVMDLTISLGNGSFGPMFAEDLEVEPGHPTVIAVSRKFMGVSPRHAGVAIFDGAVQRPVTTGNHTGSNVIEWTNAADTIVGYNNETTDFKVRTLLVSAQGVTNVQELSTAIAGFGVDIEYAAGVLYATTGVAINPLTGVSVGTYPSVGTGARVAVNTAQDRVYYVSGNMLRTYSLSTFQLLNTQTLPGVQGTARNLIRWGTESLAFSTTNGQVVLLTGNETCNSSWNTECVARPNSTGVPAAIDLTGSLSIQAGTAVLHASHLPLGKPAQFLMARNAGAFAFGNGLLCLDIFSGIYRVPGIVSSGQTGTVALPIPFAQLSSLYGFQSGTLWRFQLWYRDGAGAGSNLSNVAAATFCP